MPDPSSTDPDDLRRLVDRVPVGWTAVVHAGRRYGLRRVDRVAGGTVAIVAEELGGRDLISTNVWRTRSGDLLRPCELPADTVLAFLRGWQPAAGDRLLD